jgi:hypothetical protein
MLELETFSRVTARIEIGVPTRKNSMLSSSTSIIWPRHLVDAMNKTANPERLALARQYKSVIKNSEDLASIVTLLPEGDQLVFAEEKNDVIKLTVHLEQVVKVFKNDEDKYTFAKKHLHVSKDASYLEIILKVLPPYGRYDYAATTCEAWDEINRIPYFLQYLAESERYEFYSKILKNKKLDVASEEISKTVDLFEGEQALEVAQALSSRLKKCCDYIFLLETMYKCNIDIASIFEMALAHTDLIGWHNVNVISLDDNSEVDESTLTAARQSSIPLLIQKQHTLRIYGDPKGDKTWKFTDLSHKVFTGDAQELQLDNGITHSMSNIPGWLVYRVLECHKHTSSMTEDNLNHIFKFFDKIKLSIDNRIIFFNKIKSQLITDLDTFEQMARKFAIYVSQTYAVQIFKEFKTLINRGMQLFPICQKIGLLLDIPWLQQNFDLDKLIQTGGDLAAVNYTLPLDQRFEFAKTHAEKIISVDGLCAVLKSLDIKERARFLQLKKELITSYDALRQVNQLLDPISARTIALQFSHLLPVVVEYSAQSIAELIATIATDTTEIKFEFIRDKIKLVSELIMKEEKAIEDNVVKILLLIAPGKRLEITLGLDKQITVSAKEKICRMLPVEDRDKFNQSIQQAAAPTKEVSLSSARIAFN